MLTTPYHVIVVDDEPSIRGMIARVLVRTLPAVTISTVGTGTEALQLFLHHGTDLVITDNTMPGLSGIDLARAIRAQDAIVPIPMVSAEQHLAQTAFAAGITVFVAKPSQVGEVQAVVQRLLTPP